MFSIFKNNVHVINMHLRRFAVLMLFFTRREVITQDSESGSDVPSVPPTIPESRDAVLEAAYNDFCITGDWLVADERCKNGFCQLNRLPKHERGKCHKAEDAACRWVEAHQRYECTVQVPSTKSKGIFGFCSWRWKKRSAYRQTAIPLSLCAEHVLKAAKKTVVKRRKSRRGLADGSDSEDEYTGYEGILNSAALRTIIASNKIREIQNHDDLMRTLERTTTGIVVIILYARLCRRWRVLEPFLVELVDEYQNVVFLKKDIDKKLEEPGMVNDPSYKLPTFLLHTLNGQVRHFHTMNIRKIRKVLEDNDAVPKEIVSKQLHRQYSVAKSLNGRDFAWLDFPSPHSSPSSSPNRRDNPGMANSRVKPSTPPKESPKARRAGTQMLPRDIPIE